jgi:hypothetical protein
LNHYIKRCWFFEATHIYEGKLYEEDKPFFRKCISNCFTNVFKNESNYENLIKESFFSYNFHENNNTDYMFFENSENIICSIPEGNITAYTIRDYINNHVSLKTHIKVAYDSLKNMFEFQKISTNNLKLQIINAHTLLGFPKTENLIDLPSKSTKPINVMAITNIFLHIEAGYDLNINDRNFPDSNYS